jgi:hypothetical protein
LGFGEGDSWARFSRVLTGVQLIPMWLKETDGLYDPAVEAMVRDLVDASVLERNRVVPKDVMTRHATSLRTIPGWERWVRLISALHTTSGSLPACWTDEFPSLDQHAR